MRWFMKLGETISIPPSCIQSMTQALRRARAVSSCLTSVNNPEIL